MLDLLISPFAKIIGILLLVVGLFGAGYYKGYQKLSEYKVEQNIISEQAAKRQDIITKGIQNEYKANIARLRNTYGRVYNSATAPTETPRGANEASSNLLLDCAITTQQLVSLQDWLNSQIANQ
jgi:hypothetical protein